VRPILRDLRPGGKPCLQVTLAALLTVVPLKVIDAVLDQEKAREIRKRRLDMRVVVMLCIAMNLHTDVGIPEVLRKLTAGVRFLNPESREKLPTAGAISQRRRTLGARPMQALFRQVCRPLATVRTKGALLFGFLAVAVDSCTENVPDTPENACRFGRPSTSKGREGAFPQVRGVYLVECGTHAIIDAGFYPYRTSERVGGFQMLRTVQAGMIVLWDRGFHSYDMVKATRARGAHFLGRLPANAKPKLIRALPDGTTLVEIVRSRKRRRPGEKRRTQGAKKRKPKPVRVRLIEYTITDPGLSGYGEKHRLITSLVNWRRFKALDLVCAYHERWEIELVIDEIDTHQCGGGRVLRSKTPEGVVQELYGLVIAHYAVRALMHQAAQRDDMDPDRLSFTHALEVIKDAIPDFEKIAPEEFGRFYDRMLWEIATGVLRPREGRSNPRVVKRKMSNFQVKRKATWRPYKKLPPLEDVLCVV
jgi:hypothetical protein